MQKHVKKQIQKYIGVLSVLTLGIFALGFAVLNSNFDSAKAAGVTITVTPQSEDVSVSGNITVQYNTSADLAVGETIDFIYNSDYTGTITTANTTISGTAPSNVATSTAGDYTTATLTLGAGITTGNPVTIVATGLTTPTTAGNYTFTVVSNSDYGANFQYIGDDNQVEVRAYVPITLSFDIRNDSDTADTNICDLGTVDSTTLGTCSYRLKVTTNAGSGYTISVVTDGDLTNGTHNMVNADPGTLGTLIAAGTEAYGAIIEEGSLTTAGGNITLATAYSAGANSVAYNNTTPALLLTSDSANDPATPDLTNTTRVTHNLGVQGDTPAGKYTQTITYTVAPSF
jgi:hypothetical protein